MTPEDVEKLVWKAAREVEDVDNFGPGDVGLAQLTAPILRSLALAVRKAALEAAAVIADGGTYSDCTRDGSCSHRACVTSRLIAAELRSLAAE